MALLRLQTMATGHTGVRPETAQAYAALLNAGITPVVGEYGSLGCSGDLAPLAHVALAVMGEGTGPVRRRADARRQALTAAGLAPVELAEKEGLALINGTDGMLAMLMLAAHDVGTAAEGRRHRRRDEPRGAARHRPDPRRRPDRAAAAPRPGRGRGQHAARCSRARRSSPRTADPRTPGCRTPTRCAAPRRSPAAAATPSTHVRLVAAREAAAAIDNPVLLDDGRIESNGNFHGAPVGYALDFLAIPLADLASISERRTDRMLDKNRSGLPAFLAHDPGVDCGLMIAQYTQAGIVSELKRIAAPASADSIPSSAMQEDHVSMGWSAGRKLRRAVDGLARVLAIEVMTAARALDLRAPLQPAAGTAAAVGRRPQRAAKGPAPTASSPPRSSRSSHWWPSGALVEAVEGVTGELH